MTVRILFKNRRLSKVLLLVALFFVLICLTFTLFYYTQHLKNIENLELLKLRGISNAISDRIDGELHQKLMGQYKNKDDIRRFDQDTLYYEIHTILKEAVDNFMLHSPVYTLIKSKDSTHYVFGVTSEVIPYFRHEYHSFPSEIFDMYDSGGEIKPYTDQYGTWLSAFSVIKDQNENIVALVMVDETFSAFKQKALKEIFTSLLFAFIVFLAMFVGLVLILLDILAKEQRDMTALEHQNNQILSMQSELEEAHDELNQINELRKEMIANLSHDLRTPLSNVTGYLELLNDSTHLENIDKQHFLSISLKESHRLKSMIDDLFDLSKLDSQQINLDEIPFNINELIDDIMYNYVTKVNEKSVTLHKDMNQVHLVYGDIRYISRLFQNLLDNAVKYVQSHGFIKISTYEESDFVLVKVCNNGSPIPQDIQGKIFDRYFKVNSKNGSGLGLAIAKKICEIHGCDLYLDVNGDINSFYFTIKKYKV